MIKPCFKVHKYRLHEIFGLGESLQSFSETWKRAEQEKISKAHHGLSFEGLGDWMKTLTAKRWELLEQLKQQGPTTIYALAKHLERDYKNVHTDVVALMEVGLIDKNADGLVLVPWDEIEAHMRLAA